MGYELNKLQTYSLDLALSNKYLDLIIKYIKYIKSQIKNQFYH